MNEMKPANSSLAFQMVPGSGDDSRAEMRRALLNTRKRIINEMNPKYRDLHDMRELGGPRHT